MSLEDKIDVLTAAIDRLTAAMNSRVGNQDQIIGEEVVPKVSRKKNISEAAASEDSKPLKVKDSDVVAPLDEAQEVLKIDYSEVAAATTKLVRAKGRDAALDLLKTFGVSNAKQLKEEDWISYVSKASTEV